MKRMNPSKILKPKWGKASHLAVVAAIIALQLFGPRLLWAAAEKLCCFCVGFGAQLGKFLLPPRSGGSSTPRLAQAGIGGGMG